MSAFLAPIHPFVNEQQIRLIGQQWRQSLGVNSPARQCHSVVSDNHRCPDGEQFGRAAHHHRCGEASGDHGIGAQ